MEISLQKANQLKALAILMMLFLHLFNRPYQGLFEPLFFLGNMPISYYISLFCDSCVPIFCFVSGYGLYFTYLKNPTSYNFSNFLRIKKLFINYWIILILFAVFLGYVLNKPGYPGSFTTFVLNFSSLKITYNGAWWFLFIYLLLIASSVFFFKIMRKIPSYFIILICLFFYFPAFYFRVYKPISFDYSILNWFQMQLSLYGTSLFPFIVGAVSLKEKWNTKITQLFNNLRYKNFVAVFSIFILIVIHGLVPNLVMAPFLAIPFIFLFVQTNLLTSVNNFLDFMSAHATNLWLIHMFFYLAFLNSLFIVQNMFYQYLLY